MNWPGLPLLLQVAGRPVVLVGEGEAADAKRRLLERAGALVVGEEHVPPTPFVPSEVEGRASGDTLGVSTAAHSAAASPERLPGQAVEGLDTNGERRQVQLAVVALDDPAAAQAAAARLRARGLLVNVVDRPELCDVTFPAIVDRAPVLVAVGTGGVSAGLAAALRQRLEALLPAGLGRLAEALHARRAEWRVRFPDAADRRRAIGEALAALDLLADPAEPALAAAPAARLDRIALASRDPDDLTLRQARALAAADRVFHTADVPCAILERARADAPRIACPGPPVDPGPGWSAFVSMAA